MRGLLGMQTAGGAPAASSHTQHAAAAPPPSQPGRRPQAPMDPGLQAGALLPLPPPSSGGGLLRLRWGLSLALDAIGVVDDAVEHRVRDRWLADYLWPALHGDLTGDEDGLASVARLHDLQQVAPALGGEALQPPVIEDQQGDPAQAAHPDDRACLCRGHG